MSRTKRTFTAEFKAKIILEVIEGRRTINGIASEHNLQPNMVRNWKKEFLDKASVVFDDKREENTKQKLEESRKKRNEYAKKVGHLTMQVYWLKKNLRKLLDPTGRVNLVKSLSTTKEIPVSAGAELEGKNNLIKVIKRIAFGFRTFNHLRKRILIQQNICEVI